MGGCQPLYGEFEITEYPTAVVNQFGQGISVFFPTCIDRNVTKNGHPDFEVVLGNTVEYLLKDCPLVVADGPENVSITINKMTDEPGRYVVHLVNMTAGAKRPISRIVPVKDYSIKLNLLGKSMTLFDVLYGDAMVKTVVEKVEESTNCVVDVGIPVLEEYACFTILVAQ